MLRRLIAKPAIPGEGPHETEPAEHQENMAPLEPVHQPGDQNGGEPTGKVRPGKEDALHAAAFIERHPVLEGLGGVGPGAGFARSEQEADDQHARVVPGKGGGHGENRPPGDDARQHAARADALAPGRRRNFKGGIGDSEDGEDESHLLFRQAEVLGNVGRENGDAIAVEVRYAGESHGESHDFESGAARLHVPIGYRSGRRGCPGG